MSDLITDGTDSCESPCGCLDLNSRPSEEQSVLLNAELSLSPIVWFLSFSNVSFKIADVLVFGA